MWKSIRLLCFTIWPCFFTFLSAYNLTILHTNDVHARFQEFNAYGGRCSKEDVTNNKCYGGFARQITKVDEIRKEQKNVLYLNAGDYFQGTIWYTIFKYHLTSKIVNMLNLTAMALGNHEFDDGIKGLAPFIEEANFPVLCCNCDARGEPAFHNLIKPSVVLNIGSRKIGVIGYITPDTKFLADPGNVSFTDETECLIRESGKMMAQNINIIVAVGHSGYIREQEIAREVKDLDVIVGGHSHTFLYSGPYPSVEVPEGNYPTVITHNDGTKTLVVQDFSFGKYMGYLQIKFNSDGVVESFSGNPILLDYTVPQDLTVEMELEKYEAIVEEKGKIVVGKTAVLLQGDRSVCRMRECNMGNFLADAIVSFYLNAAKESGWTSVPIAVVNSGAIRASIEETNEGNITMEDILSVAPFQNTIDLVTVNGTQLKLVMETSVQKYDIEGKDAQGAFLQVSGIQVKYDVGRRPWDRVVNLTVRCGLCRIPQFLPVEPKALYTLAVPAYLVTGGDNYTIFSEAISHLKTGVLDTDVIERYLKIGVPITAQVEGRITFSSPNEINCPNSITSLFSTPTLLAAAILILNFYNKYCCL